MTAIFRPAQLQCEQRVPCSVCVAAAWIDALSINERMRVELTVSMALCRDDEECEEFVREVMICSAELARIVQ